MLKRIRTAALSAALLIMIAAFAYANSGPTYWSADPSMDSLVVDSNSPIEVSEEELIFDFSEEYIGKGNNSISGLVTAKYKMSNPTDDKMLVQMAFPFASDLWSFDPSEIVIVADGTEIPFQIYIGDNMEPKARSDYDEELQSSSFDSIVSFVDKNKYRPKQYDLLEIGTLLKIEVAFSGEENTRVVLDFDIDNERTKVIGKGFNGYEGTENAVRLSSWVKESEYLELFVIGDDIEISIAGYADGEMKQTAQDFTYRVVESKVSVEDYLEKESDGYLKNLYYTDRLANNQIFNLYAKTLDKLIEEGGLNYWIDEWATMNYGSRIMVLLYEIEFQPMDIVDTSVSYFAAGTMDKTETVDPLYTFEYLLNPAKNWADFNNLNIVIKPPIDHPFIIDSTIELHRNEEGSYSADLQKLPEDDLSFTLYSSDKVTFIDKAEKQLKNALYFLPIVIPIAILILILGILFMIKRKRN